MIPFQLGTSSVYIEYITLALVRSGYLKDISRIFNDEVRRAVTSFQNDNDLYVDGIVGPDTYAALYPYLIGYRKIMAQNGDTPESLANKFNTSSDAVAAANSGADWQNIGETQVTIPFSFDVVPTNVSYTYYLSRIIINGLTARYPFIGRFSAGSSVMGKQLFFLTIGSGSTEVFFNASHHANEWITTPVLFKYAEDYARSYAFGRNIFNIPAQKLYSEKTLYLLPLVNPDGVDLVTGGILDMNYISTAEAISADYPFIPYPSGWKANIEGTDLNLNYPAGWMQARENKFAQGFTSPAPRDFVGTAPLSAPESRAVYNLTLDHDFALTLSYHTQGNVIYWKYLDYEPERSLEIGKALSEVSGYALELTPSASGYAGYKDWFISYFNRPGYTIEVGMGTNPLPISQFDTIYADNIGLLTTALDMAQI